MADREILEGITPPPVKPPVPGSVLSEVSPLSPETMNQRLGDIEYRAGLVEELASNPLATLGYEITREKTGGDVSQLIKHVMSNVETGEVRGDDPENPIFGKNVRGRYYRRGHPDEGMLRINTTDYIDMFGNKFLDAFGRDTPEGLAEYNKIREAQYESGSEETLIHELGHAAIEELWKSGKADELSASHDNPVYEEDVVKVMDFLRHADLLGNINPSSAQYAAGIGFPWREGRGKTLYEQIPEKRRERLNHTKVALSILTAGRDQFHGTVELTPYEQQVANLVVKVNREAARQLTEKGIPTEYLFPLPLSLNSAIAISKEYPGQSVAHTTPQAMAMSDSLRSDAPNTPLIEQPPVPIGAGMDRPYQIPKKAAGGFIDRPLYDRNPYG